MKNCSKCKQVFALHEFFKNKTQPDGLQKWCKGCCKKRDLLRHRPYNPEKQKRYADTRAKYRQRMMCIPEVLEAKRASNREHYKNNKELYFAKATERMARIRTASVVLEDIKNIVAIYTQAAQMRKAGYMVEVDHIVPLKGKNVSGLHVSWNLQILPVAINRSKSNKFEEQI